MMRTTRRRARKLHRCPCRATIVIGNVYLEHVASPDHGDLGNPGWWRLPECASYAEICGRGHLLVGAA